MAQTRHWRAVTQSIWRAVGSNRFFYVILGVFVLQALYIALTGAYSMAYDEYFHLGIIKLYAHQWSPLLGSQPPGAATYGAVARDPSYLYHYLMSFPYRIFAHFFHGQSAQIIFLRLIDIAIFSVGLFVWRQCMRVAGLSAVASNWLLVFFTLLPVTVFVAGQLNYDNLLFLMTGVCLLLTSQVVGVLQREHRLPAIRTWLLLASVCFSAIVKYAFLPIGLAVAIYLLATFWRTVGWRLKPTRTALVSLVKSCRTWAGVAACLLFVIGFGLVMERYAVNSLRYHTPTPECDVVLSVDACRAYDPFGRNQSYKDAGLKGMLQTSDKVTYAGPWFKSMIKSLYFTVGPKQLNYPEGDPLPIAYAAGWVVAVSSLIVISVRLRWLWRQNHFLQLCLVVCGVYGSVLFLQNLSDFLSLGVPVAVQGRYLLPILIPLLVLAVTAVLPLLRRLPAITRLSIPLLLLLVTLEGGGVLPYVIRSADNWMWDNATLVTLTRGVRDVCWRLIIH